MKNQKGFLGIIGLVIIIAFLAVGGFFGWKMLADDDTATSKATVFSGTVTEYDLTPSYVDAPVVFKVDDKQIEVGIGEIPPEAVWGQFDLTLKIGDKVEAKVVKNQYGNYTLHECSSCYVRLAK